MLLPALIGQLLLYLMLMLWDEYVGTLIALIIGVICFSIWVLSYVVEWIQPSRVSRNYYILMLSGWIGPFVAVILFIALRGEISWLK